jgi:FtsH-binding integral membrane protein
MENTRSTNLDKIDYGTVAGTNTLLRSVFSWMTAAMLITTAASLLFYYVPSLNELLFVETETGTEFSGFGWFTMFAPVGFVFLMSFGFNRLSYPVLISLFLAYATLTGISLSFVFAVYQLGSIVNVFLSSLALFGIMAIAGYTTKTDLTKLGSLLFIGLIGIIVASLINLFTRSEGISYVCSILGVIIFTGLTAYDMQKIKEMTAHNDGSVTFKKYAIMGALNLYLDFINIFLYLLRLFGSRK